MERKELEQFLGDGLSLKQIGKLVGRSPSTVSYWLGKHDLRGPNADRYAPRGGISRASLEGMVAEGLSMREISSRTGFGLGSVRHWLRRYGLATQRTARLQATAESRAARLPAIDLHCLHHGRTEFRLLKRGGYRCARCTSEAVVRRRRKVKSILVEEAGGSCRVCGYDRFAGALHFHHLDPSMKAFHLSRSGVTRSLASAQDEAKKCILLCANCHAEVEAGIVSLDQGGAYLNKNLPNDPG